MRSSPFSTARFALAYDGSQPVNVFYFVAVFFVLQILLLALLLGAVLTDLHARRIPNALVLTGTTLALAAHTLSLADSHPPLAGPAWWAPLAGLATGTASPLKESSLAACVPYSHRQALVQVP